MTVAATRSLPLLALLGLAMTLAPAARATDLPASNPFAAVSPLPFHLPRFAEIHDGDYAPAFSAGMQQQLAEVARIAHDPAAPTFANTVVALERSGALLERVEKTFRNLIATNGTPAMQALERDLAPTLAAHHDAIYLDDALFARVQALHAQGQGQDLALDAEDTQLLNRTWLEFIRAGAQLDSRGKARLRTLNAALASASTRFRQNVLQSTQESAVVVDSAAELDGLAPAEISAAATAAQARQLDGKFVLTLQNTTVQPALGSLTSRALRERLYRASTGRARSGATDNRPVIAEIMRLRAERATLLGFATPADYVLVNETAGTPAAVNDLLERVAPVALAAAGRERALIQQQIDRQAAATGTARFDVQPWDWAFYAEQVRKDRFSFDEAAVKPYFELDHVLRDGAFHAAHLLYGLTFRERPDLPAYRDDVRIFEVRDAQDAPVGLFIADYFARDNKQGGAWMNTYVDQSALEGTLPVVANHLNLARPAPGQPMLLSFAEVTTLFHEFGHGLHGLLSQVRHASLSGTSVPRDFVEFPSQYNEMWARDPQVLAHFAHHYQTGAPLPQALFEKVLAAQTFNAGFETTSYVAAALLDQAWHQVRPDEVPDTAHVDAFEAAALRRIGMDATPVPVRYYSTYFNHIFLGGYSAGYYAYLWSEILARDTGKWFQTHGGLSRANGEFLRAKVLSRGRTAEPAQLFQEFYGGPPDVGPLLEYRGLQQGGGAGGSTPAAAAASGSAR